MTDFSPKTNLSGYLIGSHRMFVRLLSITKEVSEVDEGQGDAEPHGAHAQHGGEGDGSARVFAPDEEVDEYTNPQHNAWVQGRTQKCSSLKY